MGSVIPPFFLVGLFVQWSVTKSLNQPFLLVGTISAKTVDWFLQNNFLIPLRTIVWGPKFARELQEFL